MRGVGVSSECHLVALTPPLPGIVASYAASIPGLVLSETLALQANFAWVRAPPSLTSGCLSHHEGGSPWPRCPRHSKEGSCKATLPGRRESGAPYKQQTWSRSHVPPSCQPPPWRWRSAGNLTPYSARLGNAPSLLARLDDVGLSCVTNGAGTLSKPRRKPHNDGST